MRCSGGGAGRGGREGGPQSEVMPFLELKSDTFCRLRIVTIDPYSNKLLLLFDYCRGGDMEKLLISRRVDRELNAIPEVRGRAGLEGWRRLEIWEGRIWEGAVLSDRSERRCSPSLIVLFQHDLTQA